jgi:hypothetical protein
MMIYEFSPVEAAYIAGALKLTVNTNHAHLTDHAREVMNALAIRLTAPLSLDDDVQEALEK